jgi:hypothetical protein
MAGGIKVLVQRYGIDSRRHIDHAAEHSNPYNDSLAIQNGRNSQEASWAEASVNAPGHQNWLDHGMRGSVVRSIITHEFSAMDPESGALHTIGSELPERARFFRLRQPLPSD